MSDFQPYQPSKTTAFENEQDDEFEEPRNFDGALSDGNDNDPDGTEGGAGQETYTIEFLSDYEENLPEYFDANKVKRENLSNCKL